MISKEGVRSALLVLLFALALLMPVAALTHSSENAAAYSGITIQFERPSYAASSQKVQCTIRLAGGPAGDLGGNWSYKIEISNFKNQTGFEAVPQTASSETGVFKLNITMPIEAPQTITLKINASSREMKTRYVEYKESTFDLKVVDPVVIRAVVYNTGAVDAKNITARFYADGNLLSTQVFNVSTGSSAELVYNWTFLKIKSGKHIVTIEIDDPNNIVEFSDGNNVLSRTVYIGDQGNPIGAMLTIFIIVAAVLVTLMYLQKPLPRKKG